MQPLRFALCVSIVTAAGQDGGDQVAFTQGAALHRESLALRGQRRLQEAERKSLQSIPLLERHFGSQSEKLTVPLLNLATIYLDTGQTSKAENCLKRVMARIDDFSATSEVRARAYQSLASLYLQQGRMELVFKFDQSALDIMRLRYGAEHQEVAVQEANMALSLVTTGRVRQAVPILETSLRKLENAMDAQNPLLLYVLIPMALAYDSDTPKAISVLERALQIVTASYGTQQELRGLLLAKYAQMLRRNGSKDAAKKALNESREILKAYGRHSVDVNDLIRAARSPR